MQSDYSTYNLANGIRLIFMPTTKFKTISMGLFLHQELKPDLAALNALVPAVLQQGSRLYPDYLTLQRELEKLYGADLSTDIMKSGERHILAFTLETPHDKYLGESGGLLNKGMAILGSVAADPLVVDGAFREDYVRQEKSQLKKDIRAMLNDKVSYAMERCISLMCADENFGVYKLGKLDDYDQIKAEALYGYYRDLFARSPIDLYVVGDLEANTVLDAAGAVFGFSRNGISNSLPETEIMRPVEETRYIEEEMNVNQSKLVLGFRTYTGYRDPLHCALLVYSGVLGGFPHSKLFMQVREEAGLAYYINSRLEQHKGLMVISAGINYTDHRKARDIIDRQIKDMGAGEISDTELGNTKQGLINQLRSRQDSPGHMISFHLDGSVGGKVYTVEELIAGIEAVRRDEIMEVAERIKLDTEYLLKPREGGRQ